MDGLVREAEAARQEANAACGLKRTLEEALEQADEQRLKQEATIKDLQTELAELGQNYSALQRKLAAQRTSHDGVSPCWQARFFDWTR